MPRNLSQAMRAAAFAQETGEVLVLLVTLSHPSMTDDIRVASDGQDVVSRGQLYVAYPFEPFCPSDREDSPPRVSLRICNVDRRIVQAVRSIPTDPAAAGGGNGPLRVTLELVLASSPDLVEAGPYTFNLREVQFDALVVEGTLMYEDILNEPYPADVHTPARFPGLF
jgi:hypothetical protein